MALKISRAAVLVRGAALFERKLWFLVPRLVTAFLIPRLIPAIASGNETFFMGVADADAFLGDIFGDLVVLELSWRRSGDCILIVVSDAAKKIVFSCGECHAICFLETQPQEVPGSTLWARSFHSLPHARATSAREAALHA